MSGFFKILERFLNNQVTKLEVSNKELSIEESLQSHLSMLPEESLQKIIKAVNVKEIFPKCKDIDNFPLHQLVLSCTSISEVKNFLDSLEEEQLSEMVRTVNRANKLAIDLVSRNSKLDETQKYRLECLLLKFMAINPLFFKKISDRISLSPQQRSYADTNPNLYHNLQLGCFIANKTRELITASDTHPEINTWDAESQKRIISRIQEVRTLSSWVILTKIIRNPIAMMFHPESIFQQIVTENVVRLNAGNCKEFAFLAKKLLEKYASNLAADVYYIDGSDHGFLIIGEGDDAVVCDAWSGSVYAKKEIENQLKGLKKFNLKNARDSYHQAVNVVTSYNPSVHSVKKYNDSANKYQINENEIVGWQFMATGVALGYLISGMMLMQRLVSDKLEITHENSYFKLR